MDLALSLAEEKFSSQLSVLQRSRILRTKLLQLDEVLESTTTSSDAILETLRHETVQDPLNNTYKEAMLVFLTPYIVRCRELAFYGLDLASSREEDLYFGENTIKIVTQCKTVVQLLLKMCPKHHYFTMCPPVDLPLLTSDAELSKQLTRTYRCLSIVPCPILLHTHSVSPEGSYDILPSALFTNTDRDRPCQISLPLCDLYPSKEVKGTWICLMPQWKRSSTRFSPLQSVKFPPFCRLILSGRCDHNYRSTGHSWR